MILSHDPIKEDLLGQSSFWKVNIFLTSECSGFLSRNWKKKCLEGKSNRCERAVWSGSRLLGEVEEEGGRQGHTNITQEEILDTAVSHFHLSGYGFDG